MKNSQCYIIYFTEKGGNIKILNKKISEWHFLQFNFKAHLFDL